jgi:hypothetical protein
MKKITFFLLLIVAIIAGSCKKDKKNLVLVDGYVKNKNTGIGLANMKVYATLYRTGQGMGIIDGSRSDEIGTVLTDQDGRFTITAKLFDGAEAIKFIIYPANNSFSSREIRLQLSELTPEKMPIILSYE